MFHSWKPRQLEALENLEFASDDLPFEDWAHDLDKAFWEKKIRTRQEKMFRRIQTQRHLTKELESLSKDVTPQLAPGDTIMVKDVTSVGKLAAGKKGPFVVEKIVPGGSVLAKNIENGKTIRIPASHVYRFKNEEECVEEQKSEKDGKEEGDEEENNKRGKHEPQILRRSQRRRAEVNYKE